jgi:amino acid adenylation domain-containing protein
MSNSIERIANLSPEMQAQLLQRLAEQKREKTTRGQISRQERASNTCRLSFAQEQLWFLDQLEPGTAFYTICRSLTFHGPLNVGALEWSLHQLIGRHESLRTSFPLRDGHPEQVIVPAGPFCLPLLDLEGLSVAEQEAQVQEVSQQEARLPFDLNHGPLIRMRLLRLSTREHLLLLSLHHIICDGWSLELLFHDLSLLYEARLTGQPSPLSPPTLRYTDYTLWQRQWMQGEVLEEQLAYWQQQLAGTPPQLDLPTDRPRSTGLGAAGAIVTHQLPLALTQALKLLSRHEGVTLFMTLLAALAILLMRYSGQEDLMVGTPVANRQRKEVEGLVGLFINTLVLRTRLSPTLTVRQALRLVREVTLEAYSHQDLPFEKLVEALQPERDLTTTPLFQVMFVQQQNTEKSLTLKDVDVRLSVVDTGTAAYAITFSVEEQAEGLNIGLQYNTDMFNAETIGRLLIHFQTILESIIINQNQHLSSLPLLPQAEQQILLDEWNVTRPDISPENRIHHLFEAQVERTPDAIAVEYDNACLTYRELNCQANQIAHRLHELNVKAEALVGLCMERSLDTIIGLLGILKAGGAYLPLDPAYPGDRLAFILNEAQPVALLTHERLRDRFPMYQGPIVCSDTNFPSDMTSTENMEQQVDAQNLVYVIYTSGSTGKPKGVHVPHQALENFSSKMIYHYGLNVGDRVLQFASLSFDLAAEEIFPALGSGATVVLWPYQGPADFVDFSRFAVQRQLTVMNMSASYWQAWVDALDSEHSSLPSSLRLVVTGVEQLHLDYLRRWQHIAGQRVQWRNAYGVTEASVTTTLYAPDFTQELPTDTTVPIGQAIVNSEVYVLDAAMQLVPIGIPGELYIGGDGLARGYLADPELTAEKFLPHPFSSTRGARLYKTGDLVRYRSDGNLEYLGRIDKQVKVRGYRIEPGEIEIALALHPVVKKVVVLARESVPGRKFLIAYIVPLQASLRPTVHELQLHLKERLPEYMIPSAFVVLDELPYLSSGKVDYRALPLPDKSNTDLTAPHKAPRGPIETMLVDIWAEVLGIEQVGIHDNFFELGGHSLLATQAISRMRSALQQDIPLRLIFEEPTVASLAEHLERERQTTQHMHVPPLQPVEKNGSLPLSFAQEGLWFLDQLEAESSLYNVPTIMRLTGPLNVEVLEWSLHQIIGRHESLRTTFVLHNGHPEQVVIPSGEWSLPLLNLEAIPLDQQLAQVERLCQQQARLPFDLSHGPLLRTTLLRLHAQEHLLLLSLHHIICDGWSLQVLFHELSTLYDAFLAGQPSPLPPLTLHYADYVFWQRQWMQGEILEEQLTYWKEQLAEAPAHLDLPTDRPASAAGSAAGAILTHELPGALTQALHRLSRQEGLTLFMTLLTAFAILLMRYSSQHDLLVGTPVANRQRREVEGLIGLFINTLVLRTRLSPTLTVRQALRLVREVTLEAYSHQDLPFEKLVEALQPERDLTTTPLFQVMFVLQSAFDQVCKLDGLQVEHIPIDNGMAKYDLTLSLTETRDGLRAALEYRTDLFDRSTMVRLMKQYQTLLEGAVEYPELCISRLPLLTQDEQQQMLVEWNATRIAYPREQSIPTVFEEQVERTPHAIAVTFEDQHMTYQELNQRANHLAHHLQQMGLAPEDIVGVYMERSLELLVGLLSILKAGGAYLPLDAAYPPEQLAFMIADARVSILLTQQRLSGKLAMFADRRIICLDADWSIIAQYSEQTPHRAITSLNLAYVMYTSGSTGTPKGVSIPHRGIVRLVRESNYARMDAQQVFLQLTTISFDVSTLEIWGSLLNGARLAVMPPQTPSLSELSTMLQQEGVSLLWLTAGFFHQMVDAHVSELAQVQQVLAGGDVLSPEHVRKLLHAGNHPYVVNGYGPTENTTFTSCYQMCSAEQVGNSVSIGRPISNTQVYVLDGQFNPVPVGIPGELYTGGDGLARGYLNRADLTAEKFVPHPFSDEAGARIYRTGDMVRYLSDGTLEFLGRLDRQVKVRGFRIEPGEIETALVTHPELREAFVHVIGNTSSDKQLVAYVIARGKVAPSANNLRKYLQEQLPAYMIPSLFVVLDALPLTSNGKVDAHALPAPDRDQIERKERFLAPRNAVEAALVEIWAEVLGVERVGVQDNFFLLGGHSLLATQIISRVLGTFQVKLPIRTLFTAPTVEEMAEAIIQQGVEHTDSYLLANLLAQLTDELETNQ